MRYISPNHQPAHDHGYGTADGEDRDHVIRRVRIEKSDWRSEDCADCEEDCRDDAGEAEDENGGEAGVEDVEVFGVDVAIASARMGFFSCLGSLVLYDVASFNGSWPKERCCSPLRLGGTYSRQMCGRAMPNGTREEHDIFSFLRVSGGTKTASRKKSSSRWVLQLLHVPPLFVTLNSNLICIETSPAAIRYTTQLPVLVE